MAITIAVYWPVHSFEFINYDDPAYVTDVPQIQAGLSSTGLKWAFSNRGAFGGGLPLTSLSYLLDSQLFGINASAFHLSNLLLHVFNMLLVFFLFRRMTGTIWRSAFVAGLFALHPVCVEPVAWVSSRKDLVCGFFSLLSILAYASYVRADAPSFQARKKIWYGLALLFFAMGLMSKAAMVTLPFALLLLDFWPLRRFDLSVFSSQRSVFIRLALEKLPFLALTILGTAVAYWNLNKGSGVASSEELSFGIRLGNALISYLRYIGKLFWPTKLAVIYPYPDPWSIWQIVGAAVILGIISFYAFRLARRHPYFLTGWFWFLGTLIPVIGLIQIGYFSMADRYFYLPMLGLIIILVWGIADLVGRGSATDLFIRIGGAMLLLGCATGSSMQLQHWQNTETLLTHTLRVTKNNVLAYNNLGDALMAKGKVDEAITLFSTALSIAPNDFYAHANLGNALVAKGDSDAGISHYEAALRLKPQHADLHFSLGLALAKQLKFDAAVEHFRAALLTEPNHGRARLSLAASLASQGKIDEAITNFSEGLKQQPENFVGHYRFGILLALKGEPELAQVHLKEAIRLQPTDFNAHYQLALVYSAKKNWMEAVSEYRAALLLKPDSVEALNNLAWILAVNADNHIRNGAEAVSLSEQACKLTNRKIPIILGTLAAAYAEAGDFLKAVDTAQEAQDLARTMGQNEVAQRNSELLELYRDKKPFRE